MLYIRFFLRQKSLHDNFHKEHSFLIGDVHLEAGHGILAWLDFYHFCQEVPAVPTVSSLNSNTWLGIFKKNQPKNYVIEIAWKCCNRYDDEDFQCF